MLVTLAFGIGHTEVIVILAIVVVLFGASKLPQLGSAVGQTVKNFKRGMREAKEEEDEAAEKQKQLEAKEDTSSDTDAKA